MRQSATAALGLAAVVVSVAAFAFAAVSDREFFDPYHAISDMGMAGREDAQIVNLAGFGLTGVLIALFAIGMGRLHRTGATTLALGGVCFSFAGLQPFPSPWHLIGVAGSAIFLGSGIAFLGLALARWSGWSTLAPLSLIVATAVMANLALIPFQVPMPGTIAKASMAGALLWMGAVSFLLLARRQTKTPPSRAA